MSIIDAIPVDKYSVAIKSALDKAREAKPLGEIDPALASQDLEECIEDIELAGRRGFSTSVEARTNYAAIETACRDIFYYLLVSWFNLHPKTIADRTSPLMR